MTQTKLRLWTIEEYHRMIEMGILTTSDRVELLEGLIVKRTPQLPPHASTVTWASGYLRDILRGQATIRVQLPITVRPHSEPEPDITIARIDSRHYTAHHPNPEEIFWVD